MCGHRLTSVLGKNKGVSVLGLSFLEFHCFDRFWSFDRLCIAFVNVLL